MEINKKNKAVLFIPEAGIYLYLRGLAVLGSALAKAGHEVFVTKCTGQMIRCPMMDMVRLSPYATQEEKNKVCRKCVKSLQSAQKKYNFKSINLAEFVDNGLYSEIDRLVADAGSDLLNITYRGFPVGKISQFDFILSTKFPYSLDISDEQRSLFIQYIKNTALTIALSDAICKKYFPNLLVTFNEYAQCQAVRYSAELNGISSRAMTYAAHYNVDAARFMIWKNSSAPWLYQHCQKWNEGKELPVSSESVLECWRDAIYRMYTSASHIFSNKKQSDPALIFNQLELDPNCKTIVVFTSSEDERVSAETTMKIWGETNNVVDAFVDHVDWLNQLRLFAKDRPDVQVVVRIHPREGVKRDGIESKHLHRLRKVFFENSPNFRIIWPNNPMSSYDLMELADVCLVAWSLMGVEAARLGIPVLTGTANMYYPDDDFIQVAKTPEEYFAKLTAIINMPYSWRHLVKTVRFYHWRIFVTSLNLRESVTTDHIKKNVWPLPPDRLVPVINDVMFGKDDIISFNLTKWASEFNQDSTKQESAALRLGIRMFIDRIFFSRFSDWSFFVFYHKAWRKFIGAKVPFWSFINRPFKDYQLEYYLDFSLLNLMRKKTKKNKNIWVILSDGRNIKLLRRGKIFQRMSPVIAKLTKLYAESLVQ